MTSGEDDRPGTSEAIYRIGGGSVENLRMKPAETQLRPPGISVLKGGSPSNAARQMRAAFPGASRLRESTKVVGTSTAEAIQGAGFEVVADPTKKFPNHYRLIHPEGVPGFRDENLGRLSRAFVDVPAEE